MKKLIFMVVLFLCPVFVFGMRVDGIYQKYEILENGDVIVKKVVIANPDNGYFMNDAYLDRAFFFNNNSFDDDLSYAPTKIVPLRAGSTNQNLELGYDLIDRFNSFFQYVEYGAIPGDSGIYTVSDDGKNFEMRVFSPSGGSLRAYYFEYKVIGAVRVHNDVAEVYIRLHENGFNTMVRDFEARVYTKSDIIGVFARGPIGGEYGKSGNFATFTMSNIPSGRGISARVVIEPSDVSLATTKTNIDDAYTKIKEVEEIYANRRNQEIAFSKGLGVVATIGMIILTSFNIYFFDKYVKERKEKNKVFPHKYLRDFPSLDGPEVIGNIMPGVFNANYFSASLMYLIERKFIDYSTITKNDVEFRLNAFPYESVTAPERKLIEILFSKIGSNYTVTMKQIVDYSKKSPSKFMKEYAEWEKLSKQETIKKGYTSLQFVRIRAADTILILTIFAVVFLWAFMGLLGLIVMVSNIVVTILFYAYMSKYSKPVTPLGDEMFLKWSAVKNYIDDFGTFETKELPHIELWGKYMVYAMAFGLATKLEKVMKVRIQEMPNNSSIGPEFNRFRTTMMVNHAISTSLTNSISSAQLAVRASASGSGGGFSSGGGGGGFGGSGGGF